MSSSEANNGLFSAENLMEDTASREDVELESWPSMKILRAEEPGWFTPWFKFTDPNKTIHEHEYFWRTGQPLDPDNWTDDASLDRYLGLNKPDNEAVLDEEDDENETGFPLTLSLDLSDEESDYDVVEIIRDDESVSSIEFDNSLVAPPLDRGVSDWTKMPALLPKLESAELAPKELTREPSDWSKMPSVLPPLKEQTILETPEMQKQLSNWEVMPPLMGPLPSDPSQYHHVPNVMPMAPQISWEPSDPQTVATPTWLQENTSSNFHQGFMAPSVGLDYVASNGASQREMEILSPQPIMTAPVLYNGYGYAPVQQTGVMAAPFVPSQPALVQYLPPVTTAVGNNNMVVARQPELPAQFSFHYTGGEFNIIFCHVPCGMFISPSKTMTEVLVHVVFPIIYVHFTGSLYTGYAHSYMTMDASAAQSYYQTSYMASRQASNIKQVS